MARFGVPVMRDVVPESGRAMSGRTRAGCFRSLGVGERLPEAVDCARKISNLLRQPLNIHLLGCKSALECLQLILNNLQLIDRLLLGLIKGLGFLGELFGGQGGSGLYLPDRCDPILLRRGGV